jgi:hypothetical protein
MTTPVPAPMVITPKNVTVSFPTRTSNKESSPTPSIKESNKRPREEGEIEESSSTPSIESMHKKRTESVSLTPPAKKYIHPIRLVKPLSKEKSKTQRDVTNRTISSEITISNFQIGAPSIDEYIKKVKTHFSRSDTIPHSTWPQKLWMIGDGELTWIVNTPDSCDDDLMEKALRTFLNESPIEMTSIVDDVKISASSLSASPHLLFPALDLVYHNIGLKMVEIVNDEVDSQFYFYKYDTHKDIMFYHLATLINRWDSITV